MFVIVDLEFDSYGYYEYINGVFGPYRSLGKAEKMRDALVEKYKGGHFEIKEIQKLNLK
jgi:hypothetical protein